MVARVGYKKNLKNHSFNILPEIKFGVTAATF
jgi:hypothetical protein